MLRFFSNRTGGIFSFFTVFQQKTFREIIRSNVIEHGENCTSG